MPAAVAETLWIGTGRECFNVSCKVKVLGPFSIGSEMHIMNSGSEG